MSRAWMPLYIGDFLADTMHLGATERGIYISLLMHCWQHGTIPLDDHKLARISGCSPRLWHQYRRTMLQFFDVVNDVTAQHRRVTFELRRYEEISNKRKDAALQKHSKSRANAGHLHTQSQSQSPKEEEPNGSSLRSKPKRASRTARELPPDWVPDREFARSKGWSGSKIDEEVARFRDHAKAKGRTAKDWDAAWRSWVTSPYQKGTSNGARPRTTADAFDDLIDRLGNQDREGGPVIEHEPC